VLAEPHIRDGGGVEMVNLANFGETYTDNVWLHGVNYTVSAIDCRERQVTPKCRKNECARRKEKQFDSFL
jgi:hypothetical protein